MTGIVLAGGGSVRFGRDKLAEPFRGIPLLHHAVLRLAEVCGDVVLVLAPDAPVPVLPGARVHVARDAARGQGPLSGLLAGLAETRTGLALVAGGDMPDLASPVLGEMLRRAREVGAVALQDGDRFRPLPTVVRVAEARVAGRTLFDAGERSLRALLSELAVVVIDEPTWEALDPARGTLRDIDRPEDLLG